MATLSYFGSALGILLVCSVAINFAQAEKYQNQSLKIHSKYIDKNGIEFRVRKIGGKTPTETELQSLKECLDQSKDLGILFQALVATTKEGTTFYLEQGPGKAHDSYSVHNCRPTYKRGKF